jgi:hypothetical protein
MPKLNQVVAVEKQVKSQSYSELSELYKQLQKDGLLKGIARTYRPKDEEGEQLPQEDQRLQVRASSVLVSASELMAKLFDVTATKDWANQSAKADVKVDGVVLLEGVPVSYLLFLEKQLSDLHTIVKKLPVLDPGEEWTYDSSTDSYATKPVETTKTKKIPRNHVKAEATDKHPAQVEVYYEDVVVGYWKTVKYSGALPAKRVNELLVRVEKLQQAVKFAREEANSVQVDEVKVGKKFFNYLFA